MLKKFLIGTFALALMLSASVALASYDFGPSTLKVGSKGDYVKTLQTVVGATVDGSFGPMTEAKVKVWQAANGLTADGMFGQLSMAKANLGLGGTTTCPAGQFDPMTGLACGAVTTYPAGCTATSLYSSTTGLKCDATTPVTPVDGTLTGTVGSLVYSLTSGLSNEEVGEGADDVKVAGLKLDATDSESDVSISAVKLNFDRGTAATGTDLEDVATEVSLWLGSTEVARVDADVFNDDNNFEKTVSLSGAVVEKDSKADLYVKLSGISNLDTGDVGGTWTVGYTQVRFVDAQGVTTTENPTTGVETFSFNTFASSNDVELYAALKSGEEDINETHIINVDATSDTEDVELLAFTLKAKGDSDVLVKSIPVLLTVASTTIDGMVTTVDLYKGSTKIGSESTTATGTTETITFNDLDFTIDAGDTEDFTVKATILGLDSDVNAGDTVKVELTGTQVDAIDAEDESGENLGSTELTGTALGEFSSVQDIGISVKLVSTTAVKTTNDTTSDEGNFSITFDVTAFDGDVWLDKTAPTEAGTAEAQISDAGTGTLVATLTSENNLTGTEGFKIIEDTTERFTIDAHSLATASGYFKLSITDLIYALSDAEGTVAYTSNLDTFKTSQLYLTNR